MKIKTTETVDRVESVKIPSYYEKFGTQIRLTGNLIIRAYHSEGFSHISVEATDSWRKEGSIESTKEKFDMVYDKALRIVNGLILSLIEDVGI